MKLLVALALLALLAPVATGHVDFTGSDMESDESLWNLYKLWVAHHKVARGPGEMLSRFANFKETVRHVYAAADHLQGEGAARVGRLNGFADMSGDEFGSRYYCASADMTEEEEQARHNSTTTTGAGTLRRGWSLPLPIAWDWRTKSCHGRPCLTPVGHQGDCGSCWAFAATAAMEAHEAIVREDKELVRLSVQELVDCDAASYGCKGGLATRAFDYTLKDGIASADDYPYNKAVGGVCKDADTPNADLGLTGYHRVPELDEYSLLDSLTTYGPVVVGIAVGKDNTAFQNYAGDIFTGPCGPVRDHEMLLVGYTATYYILKNSYGELWGDKGYLYLKREFGGKNTPSTCGILSYGSSYPVVVDHD